MKKIILGIVSNTTCFKTNNPFDDRYYILNNYVKKISSFDVIPIGLLLNDNKVIKESLDLVDAILIPGGTNIIPAHKKIVKYAIEHRKPLLGICMGFQIINSYNQKNDNIELIKDLTHFVDINDRENINKTAHNVKIKKDSKLYKILKKENIQVNSLHKYKIKCLNKDFKISAISDDGIIEAIEYKDPTLFLMGVAWHPELLKDFDKLFSTFIKSAIK